MNQKLWILIISYGFFLKASFATPNPQVLLKKIDELYRSQSSIAQIEMNIITAHWSRIIKMRVWTQGMDDTLIAIEAPRKDRGIRSLRKKTKMWNFFPKINKVIKVPPSMMMGSWMGSDFTNDDLVKNSSFIKDYDSSITYSDTQKIVLTLKPKKETISLWGKIKVVIQSSSLLPKKIEYFDEKNKKIRTLFFKEVKSLGGRTIPTTLELKSFHKKNHKTIIRYLNAQFDIPIPKNTFTLMNLQKRR